MSSLKDKASVIFGLLHKAFKKLELELEYTLDYQLNNQKHYQEALHLMAELEQAIMLPENEILEEEESIHSDQSISLDDRDHQLLMHQLKDNINLVNDYKQQIQEIRRQNTLINKLAKEQQIAFQIGEYRVDKENSLEHSYRGKKQRNNERVREIEKKLREKQKHLVKMSKRFQNQELDCHALTQIDKLDSEIEKIAYQIRQLLD